MIVKQLCLALSATFAASLIVASPVMAQESTVHIGFSGPLSGGAAKYGQNVLEGMQMAVAEINQAGLVVGGKKVKVDVVALDDQYNPSETAINARRLSQEYSAPVVLVPHSGGCYAVQTINAQQNLLLLAYTSVPQLAARGNPLTIRIPPEFTSYTPAFVKYEMSKYGKEVAIASTDTDYGKAWTAAFKPAWEAAGGKVVADNPLSYNRATDFYSGVSRVLAAKPKVIFVGGPSEPTGLIIRQARELGFKGGFAVMDQAKLDEVAKIAGGYGALEGSIGVMPIGDDPSPDAKSFVARFTKTHAGRLPTQEASLNYTAVWATAQAMKIAGTTTDAAAIRKAYDQALKALSPQNNPHGLTGVDARGGITMGRAVVAVVENGNIKALPDSVASAK
ncbi:MULTISPECIES: ABC transporter substrate-binding protein [Burkholderiaceae]|uniref:Amino acid/amide ABC transporter substrate-binding protein (HAAT family) n=1 Tax=Paraburkholderia tropica TaxID=92647 RepID=A0ABX5MUX8_9BURK|nr:MULTISPECIES: ABC transporter substrate-binding protein [Burkholderiaceae]MBB2980726.1 branched-chain amino acid transport system substrate-binding protein [Paraburkholderia tropica]MDE1140098.1 ABC transporter substrate-binding protein [Paraburkholderia tropica]OBR48184.1 ethanolamine utilization protein EutJ [Paraburkholderia tropica]PXX18032.1 amino acid/amide ABC transporter substrate-binding protein (HAAT family) [Paraburkholderia tropica]PZW86014.1 amino acid/amide ABC transporter sub